MDRFVLIFLMLGSSAEFVVESLNVFSEYGYYSGYGL